jgi:23S rRNA (cytosine1962-C5)-methyltransferase
MFASVIIGARAAKKAKEGHPWVAVRDVLSRRFSTAGIVGVLDKKGEFLGQAFYSPRSKIALRLITRSKEKIDREFWVKRVQGALKRRKEYTAQDFNASSNAFRVVYAESDGMPSIIIDKYNDIASFQITSAGAETVKEDIVAAVKKVLRSAAIIEKDDIAVRRLEGLPLIERIVLGDKTATVITEGGLRFEVDVLRGQKTGAYLDYRRFRLNPPSPPLAKGGTAGISTALDLFCYQGWMACRLAKNFTKVIAVDASQDAITAAKRNAQLNGIPCHSRVRGDDGGIEFICADAFEYLKETAGHYPSSKSAAGGRVERQRTAYPLFDLIHLDPPPFAKGRKNLPAALKGYEGLILDAVKLLKKGGVLFVSSCSHHISEGALEKIIEKTFQVSGFNFHVIYRGIQDSDHPVMKGFSESLYLKAIAVRI